MAGDKQEEVDSYRGGIWYDPQRMKFRMWYMGGYIEHLCLAAADDGSSRAPQQAWDFAA